MQLFDQINTCSLFKDTHLVHVSECSVVDVVDLVVFGIVDRLVSDVSSP